MIISLISPQSHYLTPTHASAVLIVLLHSLSRPSFPKHTQGNPGIRSMWLGFPSRGMHKAGGRVLGLG